MSSTVNIRPRRVEVPVDVRRALARLGKITSMRLMGISDFTYNEAVSPGGRLQDKTLQKIQTMLDAMSDAGK